VHIERSKDLGKSWEKIGPIAGEELFSAIQPSILRYSKNRMQLLCRSKQGRVVEAWSSDEGQTWSTLDATALPNPNSGSDAVMLRDGRALLIYNHTKKGRGDLNVALSSDGKIWQAATRLENQRGEEYSYPAVIQTADGLVHITYTWKRERIKHVVIDPQKLVPEDMMLDWP
jgi:predicted neuraminidase